MALGRAIVLKKALDANGTNAFKKKKKGFNPTGP